MTDKENNAETAAKAVMAKAEATASKAKAELLPHTSYLLYYTLLSHSNQREQERAKDRQTNRQTDRQTGRQAEGRKNK